jgi:hypothetical protein
VSAPPRVLLVDELPFAPAYAHAAATHGHGSRRGHHGRPYHAAPRVVVDVPEADRDRAAAALQRAARNAGYWPFRACFEEGLRRAPDLHGTVELRLRASHGDLDGSDVVGSTLRDPVVTACVAREAAALHLPAGDDRRSAAMGVTLGAGDDSVFVPPPVRNAVALRQALRGSWGAVERCFSDGLAHAPEAGGRMELRFRVEPGGGVAEVTEAETRFRAIDVTRCVLGVYRAASLPAAAGARGDATFVYPLHFEAVPVGAAPAPGDP